MIQSLPSAGRQYVSNHLTTDRKDQAPGKRKPSLAAPPACRIISITDDPEPPFCRPPICLKSSDDGQVSTTTPTSSGNQPPAGLLWTLADTKVRSSRKNNPATGKTRTAGQRHEP